jgi:hypothetical protein
MTGNCDCQETSQPDGPPHETAAADDRPDAARRRRRWAWAVCIGLVAAVFAVFGQTVRFEFVNFDDDVCVYDNSHVSGGLTNQDILWAFTQRHVGAWQPLTWLSLMADSEMFGLLPGWLHFTRPGWFHFTNVLLHAAAAVLLFLALWQMTGRLWPSAFVAAVFAVHPLRAESVAWVTERRDVLSGIFFMLLLGAYAAYARRAFSLLRYAAVATLLALGLMAKPVLVTAPCLLLLLDYWPLGRLAGGGSAAGPRGIFKTVAWLVLEKVPLFALVGVSCTVAVWAQGEALMPSAESPWLWRTGNALLSYVGYLGHFFYPVHLAAPYPRRGLHLPIWQVLGAGALLAGVTAAAVAAGRKHPYGIVGWLWYLGMMLPMIGLLQFGIQAEAEYQQALEINPQDAVACNKLAWIRATHSDAKFRNGGQAVRLALRAVEVWPDDPGARDTLAAAYAEAGRFAEAVRTAQQAIRSAAAAGNRRLAEQIGARLELYRRGKPYRQSPGR